MVLCRVSRCDPHPPPAATTPRYTHTCMCILMHAYLRVYLYLLLSFLLRVFFVCICSAHSVLNKITPHPTLTPSHPPFSHLGICVPEPLFALWLLYQCRNARAFQCTSTCCHLTCYPSHSIQQRCVLDCFPRPCLSRSSPHPAVSGCRGLSGAPDDRVSSWQHKTVCE